MKRAATSARKVSGTNAQELAKSIDSEFLRLWNKINDLTDKVNSLSVGTPSIESKNTGIRLIQDKDAYHIEGKFKDGWARLGTTTTLLGKKD